MVKNWFTASKDEVISHLKTALNSKNLLFIGKYETDKDNNFGFFKDVRSESGVRKFYPINNGQPDEYLKRPVEVWSKKVIFFNKGKRKVLENGKWYKFYTTLSHQGLAKKENNPFLLQTDLAKAAEIGDFTGYDLIENIQKDAINTPESVIGKLTRSIEAISNEINTQAATFIFELIQNADDYPNKEKDVSMSFNINDRYLIIKHNGAPFQVNNTVAICDINEGDKRGEIEKIGFKGIGFKSIFKDCDLAYIRSGEYSFRFDEQKWKNEGRKLFWQITPINTHKNEYNNLINSLQPVNLIIKPREPNKLEQYKNTFQESFKDERILLFLRNVKEIKFGSGEETFSITSSKTKWNIKKEEGIELNDEVKATLERGIALNDKRIPLKFKDIEKTEISFGFSVNDKKVNFLNDANIFTYLPTKVNLGFGFLLNGNFIPDGSRTMLHKDLLWNEYLFEKAGELFPKQLLKLIKEGNDASSVINLIPDFDELHSTRDKDIVVFIEAFKRGFFSSIAEVDFIPNQENDLVSISNILIDDSGISNIIEEEFNEIFELGGELISSKIEKSVVKKLKNLITQLKPNTVFTLDELYAAFKKGVLNKWLLVPSNNAKFISYLGKSTVRFNKFNSDSIILGYDTYNEEKLKLYKAYSLFIKIPFEAQFVALPIIHKLSYEALLANNLAFELKEFNIVDFLNIILTKVDEIEADSERLDKAWHFLFKNREIKINGSVIVNQRFKKFPIKTIGGGINNLDECFVDEAAASNQDYSFLYSHFGNKNITKVNVSALAVLFTTNVEEVISFLCTINSDIKNTSKALFKETLEIIKNKKVDVFIDKKEFLVEALISVFRYYKFYEIKLNNLEVFESGLCKFPVLNQENDIKEIRLTYFGENYRDVINESELKAPIIYKNINDINFISIEYLQKIEEEEKKEFISFLKHCYVSVGLKYFLSNFFKQNNLVNVSFFDVAYSKFNNGNYFFKTSSTFYLFTDISKLSGKKDNLVAFWNALSDVPSNWYLTQKIKCYTTELNSPLIWLLKRTPNMFPLANGELASFSTLFSPKLSPFIFNNDHTLNHLFKKDNLKPVIDALGFNKKLTKEYIIECFKKMGELKTKEQVVLIQDHFFNTYFEPEELDLIKNKGYLPTINKTVEPILNLIYLDEKLQKSSLVVENNSFSTAKLLKTLKVKKFDDLLKLLNINTKTITDIRIKEIKESENGFKSKIKSHIVNFIKENALITPYNKSDFLDSFDVVETEKIELELYGYENQIYSEVDSYYNAANKIIYYRDIRDLCDALFEEMNWAHDLNRKLRKELSSIINTNTLDSKLKDDSVITQIKESTIEQNVSEVTDNNDSLKKDIKDFIQSLDQTVWGLHTSELKNLVELDVIPKLEKQKAFNLIAKLKVAKHLGVVYNSNDDDFNCVEKHFVHSVRSDFAYVHPNEILKMHDEKYKIAFDFGFDKPLKIYNTVDEILEMNVNHLLLYKDQKSTESFLKFCENNSQKNKSLLIVDSEIAKNNNSEIMDIINMGNTDED